MRVALLVAVQAVLVFPSLAWSEACDDEAALRRGGWVQGGDAGGAGNAATSRYKAQIVPLLDEVAGLVRAAYPEPVGSQGKWSRGFGLESFADDQLATYELVVNFKGYGCDRSRNPAGEVTQHSETATWLYIQFNSFWSGNSRFDYPQHFLSPEDHENLYTIQPQRVLRTPAPGDATRRRIDASLPDSILAHPNFTHEGDYDSWEKSYLTREVSQVVFLTPDGGLPYDPVTIGEFLDVNEARLRATIARLTEYDDPEIFTALLDRVGEHRRRLAGRLQETAHIRSFSWNESDLSGTEPFVGPENGYMLARRSARHASAGEPWRPRFITVFWRWQPEVPYSVRVHEAIRDRLDFARLAALVRP